MSDKKLDLRVMLEGLYNILKNEGKEPIAEKATSKSQQRFFGMVHAAQKGEKAASPEVAKVAKSMKKKDVADFAKTKHKGIPDKVSTEDCEMTTDENWQDYLHRKQTSHRRNLDNPWEHLHKIHTRHYKNRIRKEEAAGVGIITPQNTTCDVDKNTPKKNLAAFQLAEMIDDMTTMLIKEGKLVESGVQKLDKSAASSIKGALTTPEANNNAGDAYKSYRFGLALAGAPDFPTKTTNDIGGDPLLTTYSDAECEMVKYAAKQAKVGRIKHITSNKSVEKEGTNTKSAVANIKKNKYGV